MTNPFKISIDEAGNTGQDLLNAEQQAFILASNNFSYKDIQTLKALFPNHSELHFKKLKKSSVGRDAVINFLNHELITEKNIVFITIHKELSVVGHIVDRLIEPVYYSLGIDLYKNGQNIALMNYIYVFGNFRWDKQLFNKFLKEFIEMIRIKSDPSIENFYDTLNILYESIDASERPLLLPIIKSKTHLTYILKSINKFSIDLTLSSFLVICDFWYKKLNKKIEIVHDNSKQIAYYEKYIEFIKNSNVKEQQIGFGLRTMTFPLPINSLTFVDSAENDSVQISDLIASSLAFMYSNNNSSHEKFVESIKNSKLLTLSNFYTIWPGYNVPPHPNTMENITGQNAVDFLAVHAPFNIYEQ